MRGCMMSVSLFIKLSIFVPYFICKLLFLIIRGVYFLCDVCVNTQIFFNMQQFWPNVSKRMCLFKVIWMSSITGYTPVLPFFAAKKLPEVDKNSTKQVTLCKKQDLIKDKQSLEICCNIKFGSCEGHCVIHMLILAVGVHRW